MTPLLDVAVGVNVKAQLECWGFDGGSLDGARLTLGGFVYFRFHRGSKIARFRALRPPHVIFAKYLLNPLRTFELMLLVSEKPERLSRSLKAVPSRTQFHYVEQLLHPLAVGVFPVGSGLRGGGHLRAGSIVGQRSTDGLR